MSKGSFYYYFDDKGDLFSTVADLAWAIVLPVDSLDLESLGEGNFWASLEALMAGRTKVISLMMLTAFPAGLSSVPGRTWPSVWLRSATAFMTR